MSTSRADLPRPGPSTRARVLAVSGDTARERRDDLATEEPLEIRLSASRHVGSATPRPRAADGSASTSTGAPGGAHRTVAITMRTPGHDFELAAGFLYGEGIITPGDLSSIAYCTDEDLPQEARYNTVTVRLRQGRLPELPALDRHFMTSSACGVCGSAGLEVLHDRCAPLPAGTGVQVAPKVLYGLPDRLRAAQSVFGKTGGLHAAGLFTAAGDLVAVREDVGRHNAVDKLVGWALMTERLPLRDSVLLVSGRSSYEIMQKALSAGIPVVCSVSAPSSLAVDLAREFGMTLVGFLRDERFNVYSAPERIATP
ncbi:formate dehydrogenase accessory sulfurtransferase FdhD [Streptosporangium pseudovulgare]|uniref:formate dehydrogenase accessory sulfurtransferase FdhD n=1 Tax=Streptosporangium pseudovulgare TaxID=35765 RepID=UPI00167172EA|nr:formate dehydrogenase accessory sulfurtransferase FdhD [Streptosporangium pseudovulgare]